MARRSEPIDPPRVLPDVRSPTSSPGSVPPAPGGYGPRPGSALVLGFLLSGALFLVLSTCLPEHGEGAWLRWLRSAAQHPIRTGWATSLLLMATRRPLAPGSRDPGPDIEQSD